LSIEELKELLSQSQATIVALRNEMEMLNNAIATATATRSERERSIEEHRKATIRPEENENLDTLKSAIEEINELNRGIIEEIANINATLLKNEENSLKFAQYKEDYEAKQKFAKEIGTLNTMFGSATGDKLMKLAQGYTLGILLDVANVHLKEITGRYELARISDKSLGIKIIDLDMLSESRSVHSLSGGETFLVSFALSLALSSISSNRMSIESLFIDEGFGTLDSETLRTVMSALERLQSQGRTIGVISHSSEMLEQIPVKVAVIKQNAGRSRIEIKEA
jgi:exonuclease SbcC